MTARQQRLGAAEELEGDQRRLPRRLTGGVPQPPDGLLVAALGAEHQMIGHVQPIRARGHQCDRGLAMQEAASRRGHVLVDRVVHELMPEHDAFVDLVEKLGVERLAQLPGDVGRRTAGDSGHIAKRHRIAEHGRDPE